MEGWMDTPGNEVGYIKDTHLNPGWIVLLTNGEQMSNCRRDVQPRPSSKVSM